MKKRINSFFLAMLALFAFQGNISAQTAEVIFEETFATGLGEFTTEGYDIWGFDEANSCVKMCTKDKLANEQTPYATSYFISPEIKAGTGNTITFDHSASYDWYTQLMSNAGLYIRTIGGEWTKLEGLTGPTDTFSGTTFNSVGEINIPTEFENQNVQIAFGYNSISNVSEISWYFKNFVFKGIPGATDPTISEKTLFDKSGDELFNATFNGFSIEGYQGLDQWNTVWNFNTWGGPFGINVNNIAASETNIETYFVTPVIRLHVNNKIEVGHTVIGYEAGEAEKHLSLCIREEGSETWENVEGMTFGKDSEEIFTDFLAINSKYNDKKVQFGFKYTAENATKAGTWNLSSIMVVGDAPDPVDPQISFDVTECSYEIGSRFPFEGPVLNNPFNLPVEYSTDNYEIASVNNGKVEITGNKEGVVTITARTQECIEYLAGEASYKINVVNPILIFKAPFTQDECGFVEETTTTPVWKFNYGNIAAQTPVESATTSYYVSPKITLSADGNYVSFFHAAQGIPNLQEHAALCIRTVDGEWTEINVEKWPAEGAFWWDFISTGDILVPSEFNGKTVQFGFRFTLDETTFAENVGNDWPNTKYVINNFLVTKYVERADANLSFNKNEYTYYIGEIPFNAPKVNNPNELPITYSMQEGMMDVASINSENGEVKVFDEGSVNMFARSQKYNDFNAGEASYKLNIVDLTLVFRAKFGKSGLCDFTEEGETGIWSFDGYVNTGAASNNNLSAGAKGYLVSPVFELDANGNKASWRENGYNCEFDTHALFAVREEGGEWTEISNIDRTGEDYGGMKTVYCDIPEQFNGKKVQVAFIFIQEDPSNWMSWNVNDLKIRKEYTKENPEITFDKTTANYVIDEEFVAPVLSNPNDVNVKYTSSDILVATVNEVTGKLEFVGDGTTIITANSEEDNRFLAGSASYTLSVSLVPTGINGVAIDLNNAKIYDLQGNKVQNVVKGNIYIINGKKVLVK